MTILFQVGETYETRSSCDYDCVFTVEILRRTKASVWIKDMGKVKRRALSIHQDYKNGDVECFYPFGRYSMAPIIRADRRRV